MNTTDLKIVKDATCTFCGCVCDDIELHVRDRTIEKAKGACVRFYSSKVIRSALQQKK